MLKTEHFLALLVLCFVSCDAREINCPESTRPHKTECNKYFKCIKLPSNSLTWITLTCQEGLIYDKNLRSCAIPPENWDCNLSSEVEDDDPHSGDSEKLSNNNEHSDLTQTERIVDDEEGYVRKESDEFLEVIDGDKDFSNLDMTSRSDDDDNSGEDISESSGDDGIENFVTPASAHMITTQVQRLSQLVQNIPKTSDDITADDINSYLDTQKIQSSSSDYRYNSNGKTTVPADGKVHPEIESEIINMQNTLNARLTTLPMEFTTPPTSIKPIFYINKEPITEIKLKHGMGLEGIGTHQIVVNRPEGSVMFNVPATSDNTNKQNQPYLSQDILKTILELSKQMVSQKTSSNQENHQQTHPIYYAVPVPIVPPQNNVQNYYGQFPNQTINTSERPQVTNDIYQTTPQYKQRTNYDNPYKAAYHADESNIHSDPEISNNLGPYQALPIRNTHNHHHRHHQKNSQQINNQYGEQSYNVKSQQGNYQNYNQQQYTQQYPSNYYNNYPQNYQQYYNPQSYYQPSENERYNPNPQNNVNQFSNYNGAYYGNRPFVSDSSAPFVDQHTYNGQKYPYRKESFSSPSVSYETDEYDAFHEESDDEAEKFNDDLLDDDSEEEQKEKDPTDGLICTFAVARQVNKTDCFKYYVCNAKTKEILSYSCPEFTAFNDQTKYCDSGMYKECKKSQDRSSGSFKNKKYYAEAQKALQQAKRESQKVERIANMVKKQSQQIMYNRRNQIQNNYDQVQDVPNYYQPPPIQQAPIIQRPKQTKRTRPKSTKRVTLSKSSNKRRSKPKKVKCISDGNIPDPEDIFSYWHCFKSTDGRMKRIHKKCSSNLRFCSDSRYCSPSC